MAIDRCSVLVLDDEPAILAMLRQQLASEFDVRGCGTVADAKAAFTQTPADIVVSDLQLQEASGLSFLEWVYRNHPQTARVLLTGTARLEDAAAAINTGHVHRLVLKPWRPEDLLGNLRAVAHTVQLERRHEKLVEDFRHLNGELEARVTERTGELETRTHQLQSAMSELEHKNQILEKMALTDPLTGLPNRRAIDLIARKELLRRTRVATPLAVGLIDADHFKDINSAHLLSGGDFVLIWLGKSLHSSIRAADSMGRVGGEEFLVVAPDTDRDGATVLAERLRANIDRSSTSYHGKPIKMTVSIGFAVADAGVGASYDQLRELAALSLADAKQNGRNRCVVKTFVPTVPTEPALRV